MKKRVKNRSHKLLIKKKNSKWIILNNDKFFLTAILAIVFIFGFFLTLNSQASSQRFSGEMELAATNNVVDNFINWVKSIYYDYLLPTDIGSIGELGSPGMFALITIIGIIVFSLIIFEIASFLPLSMFTNSAIAVGVIIILVATKIMRNIIWGLMSFVALGAGIGGVIGMIMTGVILVIIGIAIFTGATWAHTYLNKLRYNRELQIKSKKAYEAAANVSALNTEASNVRFK